MRWHDLIETADAPQHLLRLTRRVRDDMVARHGPGPALWGHCEESAGDLAAALIAAGIDGKLVHGHHDTPHRWEDGTASAITGHTWVVVPGFILDPTREQFGDDRLVIPERDREADRYHEEHALPFAEIDG